MKILVTGGAGFIGSHLVEQLLKQNHTVITLDDLSNGRKSFLDPVLENPNHQFIQGSVLETKLLYQIIKDCDAVFHLAAVLGVKNTVENPLKVIEGNVDGTRNVLEAAYLNKTKVIFTSTSEVYGKNDELPFHENSNRVLGPTTTPRWCYASAKALDEHMCFAYGQKGLPVTVVRYFNAYGPRATSTQYGGVVPKFITAALKGEPLTIYGNGEQTRSFTFVEDTVRGTIACLDPIVDHQVLNIGINEEITINELAKKIKTISGSQSSIVYIPYEKALGKGYEDTPHRVPNITKAKELLAFQPNVSLDEGLKRTIDWYEIQLIEREGRG
ncbi:NAD-dependent epimerase/dehydratase family protein [Guptibacillus hwajinpoensis]|uniref:UDP-glucose 4-epimerase n=1 Tax=Guptibacillus hwajinpoensis TaxID=208199 RepID=A0ABU0K004_9BACL|nr:NAD-dependent epimerase/dehydratase family protein [Alkalihalobacillus hemicentroti]MDQ0482690.1 UDP-glucose 4-epimerase [Alkalihalobacillus hemicentroti]